MLFRSVPRADRNACWEALVKERALPAEPRVTELREARLLLVPFWRHVDEAKRSVERRGIVNSAADLTPIGLPCLTRDRQWVKGLAVEETTRTGDGMGRLAADSPDLVVTLVDVMFGPDGSTQSAAAGPDWRLVYYPIWSFNYSVYCKEHFHAVDRSEERRVGKECRL